MKWFLIIFFSFGVTAPRIIFSQTKNRISIQTGLFHSLFDQTPLINNEPNEAKKKLNNLFGGVLLDSKGIQYQRSINSESIFSIEIMDLSADYFTGELSSKTGPFVLSRNIKTINVSFFKRTEFTKKVHFIYGGGLNYRWGYERIYLYSNWAGWGWEPRFYGYYRNDYGLNIRSGFEFQPIEFITLYTNIDFIGTVFLGAKDIDGNNAKKYSKENFNVNYFPSRFDLSWRFGIGFNF